MMKRFGLLVGVVVCAVSLGSCKILEQLKKTGAAASTNAATTQGQGQAPSGEEEKDDQLSDKLEGYIYCMNYETQSVYRMKDLYLRDVDEAKGPTGKENHIYVLTLSPEACIKRIDESKKKAPALSDLDAAATEYGSSLSALDKIVNPLHDYYDHGDFKDDKFAKGKAMHKPLVDALNAFEKADKAFESKVSTLNDGVQQRRLARLKSDPKAQLQYQVALSMDGAKKLVKLAEVGALDKLDANGYNTALANYEQTYNNMNSYIDGHAAEADKVMMLSSFKSASSYYLKAAKELMRRKRDNKDFAKESGSPENIDGHPAQVLAKYNDLIRDSNNLQFRQ
ncbi:MAG TPA: DUF3829 domain-containing protein [Polyangiaceae bacterium]|jgi:hypothetical protein|nr:DUF3829 domain-containing protein [Polyangiaceae bacterium]